MVYAEDVDAGRVPWLKKFALNVKELWPGCHAGGGVSPLLPAYVAPEAEGADGADLSKRLKALDEEISDGYPTDLFSGYSLRRGMPLGTT
eukprot:398674-Amphidinium_carterae.1